MQKVYTNRFLIHPAEGEDLVLTVKKIADRVREWIEGGIRRNEDRDIDVEVNEDLKTDEGAEVRWHPRKSDTAVVLSVDYEHPDRYDPDKVWKTEVRLAALENVPAVEFQLDLSAGYQRPVIRPPELNPHRPRLIRTLVENHRCTSSMGPLSIEPEFLTESDIADFVLQLEDPDRDRPFVLVSPDNKSGDYLVDPWTLSDQLVGLAETFALEDIDATFSLSAAIGREHGCFNGAVRIYWPGFSDTGNPHDHPLFLGRKLKRGRKPANWIKGKVYRTAASQAREGEVYRQAMDRYFEEAREARQELSTMEGLREELEKTREELEWRKDQVERLREERDNAITSLSRLGASSGEVEEPVAEVDLDEAIEEMATAAELLDEADGRFERLRILDDAFESAEDHRSKHLDRLLDCLRFLNDLGVERYSEDGLGMPVSEFATKKATEYGEKLPKLAMHESETNRQGKLGEQRKVSVDGEAVVFEKHFTIGPGSQENDIQLFWEFNDELGLIDVGYCGPHLDHSTAST